MLPERPALYINSFDVRNGVRFIFSKHYIDTLRLQPRGGRASFDSAGSVESANDMSFARLDPRHISLADAVYASSAFPGAYPVMEVVHCGQRILFGGTRIHLADGALSDNNGLLTLLAQMRANLTKTKGSTALVVSIDASYQEDPNDEASRWWEGTVLTQAITTVGAALERMTHFSWATIEGTGVVTDQLRNNWSKGLVERTGNCGPRPRAHWHAPFEAGRLRIKPLVLRLSLQDVLHPDFFEAVYEPGAGLPADLRAILPRSEAELRGWSTRFARAFRSIPTDFALTDDARKTLDDLAVLLVHLKLSGDINAWNAVSREKTMEAHDGVDCPL
jgi:Patatin-like phospholipase